jgi:tetratricopeptide (TPR) repeat protein
VPVVWVGLGELELREKRYDAALEVAQNLQTHFPDNVLGYDIEAAAYRGKGQVAQALAASEAALRIDRSSRRVNALASALASAGQPQQGITMLQDWLEQNAEDGAGWANLGMLNQQSGQAEEAVQAYERSLNYTDPNPVILNNLAWLYLDRNPERALELATQAYELAPSRAEIVDTYGWVLFQQGRKSDGLAALQQALIIAPRNAEIGLHVAQALHAMDRDGEARPILERIARENPGSAVAESARDLLDRLRG